MSRIIRVDSAGKERNQLSKAAVLAVRELARLNGPGNEARDLAAFLALALERVAATIDISVAAWEKRGYWVKADKFRMEWEWAGFLSKNLRQAVLDQDWDAVVHIATQVARRLQRFEVPENNRIGKPWTGAWETLQRE